MLPQFWMTVISCKPLVVSVAPSAIGKGRVLILKFIKQPGSEPVIDDVVGVFTDYCWTFYAFRAGPSLEAKYLLIKLVLKCLGPSLKFFRYKPFQNRSLAKARSSRIRW